ncbi:GntR family transcriptional regulator [Nisaea sediminum]|uniref:GntR family transcriptional regulator n=1 Tax=Nisaea sediminum TaxID=2775867 RepID=UPI001869672C|nr:GntR family transcriptional regulator [Nisaea sediminum]
MSQKQGDRAERLAEELRRDIISGALKPGAALRQEELAKSFGSSRMPIREALRTLGAEGLVQLLPNRGAVVSPIDPMELRENVEMREAAETLAMRVALPHLSNAQIDKAAALQEEIARADLGAFGGLNKAFHLTLYAPSSRPRLLAHIAGLHDIAERYLRLTLVELDYVAKSSDEHAEILEACYRRDADAAVAATSRHILEAGKTLLDHLREGSSAA